jgi:hypothetical protein
MRFIAWLLALLGRERADIGRKGADGNPDVYLTRWTLLGQRFSGQRQKLFLHCFHRSDHEDIHDHPWPFWSLILWRGYWEVTREWDEDRAMYCRVRRWKWPGMLLRRSAEWQHRVEIPFGKKVWSLVWTGPKERSWGFWCSGTWRPWREHAAREEAGLPGCG